MVFPKLFTEVLLLPRCSHSFKSWFLMQLLHSSFARHLLPNVCPFWVTCITLSLVCLSVASVQPLVPYDSIPYAVPFLHGGSSLCRKQPTSSGTHHCPGSVSLADHGALWLDASPYVTSSVL
jgi:predicted ATPase with chaperone activity